MYTHPCITSNQLRPSPICQSQLGPSQEVEDGERQNAEISTKTFENGDDTNSKEPENMDTVENESNKEVTINNLNEDNHRQDKTLGRIFFVYRNERKEIIVNSTPSNSLHYELKCSNKNENDDDNVCPECNFAFSTRENLAIHLKNLHPQLELMDNCIKPEENSKFKCKQCPYISARPDCIKNHTKAEHDKIKNHVCGECGYVASQKIHLKRHIEGVHENIKHVCEKCGYAASQKGNLKTHIKAVHEKTRNHVCGECGYATSDKRSLKRHVDVVHKNIRNHVCEECGYATSTKGNLKTHINAVHENIRNHVCRECGYAAKVKGKLKIHIEAVHEG